MVVGVCGFGYTGSGAVIDLLKEYEEIQVQDGEEFGIVYKPDGLQDLAFHVNNPARYMNSDVSIYRFIKYIDNAFNYKTIRDSNISEKISIRTEKFIKDISCANWNGFWSYDLAASTNKLRNLFLRLSIHLYQYTSKISKNMRYGYPCRKMHLSYRPTDFYEKSRQYITDILNYLGYDDDKILVLNQAYSGDDPASSFPFFKNPKAICVDKDPRDLYFLCRELQGKASWTPTEHVEEFIKYYSAMRANYKYLNSDENILLIKFEDLIYNYEETVSKIENFIGLDRSKHINKFKYFKPDLSKSNTQLFRKYNDERSAVNLIEDELKEYLFDYSKYPELKTFGKVF